MKSTISSRYTRKPENGKVSFSVKGQRFSVHQKGRRFLAANLLPALLIGLIVWIVALLHKLGASTGSRLLLLAVGLLLFLAVRHLVLLDRRRIQVAAGQGLYIRNRLVPRQDIRSVSITRLKSHLYDEGSSYLSAALPGGEHRLSPYIDKEVAKNLLRDLSAALNQDS